MHHVNNTSERKFQLFGTSLCDYALLVHGQSFRV